MESILTDMDIAWIPQYVVYYSDTGFFILDYLLVDHGIAIECDGIQHFFKAYREYDELRSRIVKEVSGITIKRFTNSYILSHPDKVKREIRRIIEGVKQSRL